MSFQGPLPSVDAGSILQEQSKRALQEVLPPAEFIFRDERMDDYGVDGVIELLIDRKATNIRAQVQLKARSNTRENKDGSVAVQVSTANLNYLLNGICPTYILYRPETNELRFVLARDEWARLESENSSWREQQWITLNFRRTLTPDSIAELKDSIIREARVRRSVDEQLNTLRSAIGHAVIVDAASSSVTDSREILSTLEATGQTLIASGLARIVVERARLVPINLLLAAPKAALAVACAYYHLSSYYDAAAAIRQLLLSKPILDFPSRSLLDFVFISVRRMLGELDEEHYECALRIWSKDAPPDLATQYETYRVWSEYLKSVPQLATDRERRIARDAMRETLRRARNAAGGPVLDFIELLELTLHQHEVSDVTLDAKALQRISSIGIGDAHFAREVAREAQNAMAGWLAALEALANRTRESAPQTYCKVLLLRNFAALERERQRQYAAWSRGERQLGSAPSLVDAARESLRLARLLEDRELELSSMLDLAETLDTCGHLDEATAMAQQVLEVAGLVGSELHSRHARRFLSGESRTASRLQQVGEVSALSEEEIMRRAGDEQVLFMATTIAAAYRLPQSRVPNLHHSLLCQRRLARERRDWCKHIALAEFRKHDQSALTMYSEWPLLKVVCMKFNQGLVVTTQDPERISEDFRQSQCAGCPHRDPEATIVLAGDMPVLSRKQLTRNQAKAARRSQRRKG